jgi:cell division initiation protein
MEPMMLLTADATPTTADTRRLPAPDRSLKVTPLDLRQMKLSTAMRGYDKAEVTSLMLEAADGYEQALRDNDRLRTDIIRLEAALAQHRELEGSLRTTLMSAQKVADDMRENANSEAGRIIREAEGKAELLLQRAQARVEDIQREVDALMIKRREAETGVETIISVLHNTLDFIRQQEQRERPVDKVVSHRPWMEAAV